jgi:hypothetical protein
LEYRENFTHRGIEYIRIATIHLQTGHMRNAVNLATGALNLIDDDAEVT